MNTTLNPAFIAAIAAFITAIGTLVSSLRTSNTVEATQRAVAQVHKKVDTATNGQHDELVKQNQDLLRRIEAMEGEVNTIYRAFVEQVERRQQPARLRWRKDRTQ